MNRLHLMGTTLVVLASIATTCAAAHTAQSTAGPFLGVDVGRAAINLKASGAMPSRRLGDSTSLKVFGGWKFSETIGVEAGAVDLGRYDIAGVAQGSIGTRSGRLSSVYGAVTGRMAVGQDVGLTGRLGLASGRAAAPELAVPTSPAAGRKTSPIFGLGIDYRVGEKVALTLSYDYHGRLSKQITANSVSVGVRLSY